MGDPPERAAPAADEAPKHLCRNGENTLETSQDWELESLDAEGEGASEDDVEGDEDDGDWELESLDVDAHEPP